MTEIDQIHTNPLTTLGGEAWGWQIAVYLFLGGVTAGLMVLSVLLGRRVNNGERSKWSRWLAFAAPILISVGMLALWLDLESKLKAYRFYLAFRWTSPMSWGAWILLAIYPATILLGLGQLTEKEASRLGKLAVASRQLAQQHFRALGWTNVVLGVALGSYTGILLSTLAARAAWNVQVLGPLFLLSGLSTGAALMMLFPMNKREHSLLRRWDLVLIGGELALLLLFILGLAFGHPRARAAAQLLLGGHLTALFWSLVVIAGLLVPLAVEIMENRRHLRPTIFAPALLLVGGLSLRWILLVAGQTV